MCRIPRRQQECTDGKGSQLLPAPLSVSQFRSMPCCTFPKDLSTSQRTTIQFCYFSGASHSVLFRTHNYKQNSLLAVKTMVSLCSLQEHVLGEKCQGTTVWHRNSGNIRNRMVMINIHILSQSWSIWNLEKKDKGVSNAILIPKATSPAYNFLNSLCLL